MFLRPIETKQMQLMMRYVAAAERAWNKALSELRRLQTERRKSEKVESRMAIRRIWAAGIASQPRDAAGVASEDIEQRTPEVGFVSFDTDAVSEPSEIQDMIAA